MIFGSHIIRMLNLFQNLECPIYIFKVDINIISRFARGETCWCFYKYGDEMKMGHILAPSPSYLNQISCRVWNNAIMPLVFVSFIVPGWKMTSEKEKGFCRQRLSLQPPYEPKSIISGVKFLFSNYSCKKFYEFIWFRAH